MSAEALSIDVVLGMLAIIEGSVGALGWWIARNVATEDELDTTRRQIERDVRQVKDRLREVET